MNPLIASTSLTKIGTAFLLLMAGIGVALGIAMKDLKENDPATKGPKTKARKKMALGAVLTGAILALACLLAACSKANAQESHATPTPVITLKESRQIIPPDYSFQRDYVIIGNELTFHCYHEPTVKKEADGKWTITFKP